MRSNVLIIYYAATAVFLTLDYGFGINLRAVFLENTPGLRMGYYLVLFCCIGLLLWRPQWSTFVGAAYVSYVQGAKALASRSRSD